MFSQALCLCARGHSVWEPLTFHTHLLTPVNPRCADSWVLPWPWGVEVHRAHGVVTHTQGEVGDLGAKKKKCLQQMTRLLGGGGVYFP